MGGKMQRNLCDVLKMAGKGDGLGASEWICLENTQEGSKEVIKTELMFSRLNSSGDAQSMGLCVSEASF